MIVALHAVARSASEASREEEQVRADEHLLQRTIRYSSPTPFFHCPHPSSPPHPSQLLQHCVVSRVGHARQLISADAEGPPSTSSSPCPDMSINAAAGCCRRC